MPVISPVQKHDTNGMPGDKEMYKSLHQRDSRRLVSRRVNMLNKDLPPKPTDKISRRPTVVFATPVDNSDDVNTPKVSIGRTSTLFHSSSHGHSSSNHASAKDIFKDKDESAEGVQRQTVYIFGGSVDLEAKDSPLPEDKPFKSVQGPNLRRRALRKKAPAPLSLARSFSPPPSNKSLNPPTIASISRSGSGRDRRIINQDKSNTMVDRSPRNNLKRRSVPKPIPIRPLSMPKYPKVAPSHVKEDSTSSAFSNTPHTPESSQTSEDAIPPKWIFSLKLTLEELFKGGHFTYRIATRLLNGKLRISEVEVKVMPGWKKGTRVIFPDAGHERKPGVFQDLIFIVDQLPHDRFERLGGGKLVLSQDVDLVNALDESSRKSIVRVLGIDGNAIGFTCPSGIIHPGQETTIKGHGMPIRSQGKVIGRGNLVIRWNVVFPTRLTPYQLEKMRNVFN